MSDEELSIEAEFGDLLGDGADFPGASNISLGTPSSAFEDSEIFDYLSSLESEAVADLGLEVFEDAWESRPAGYLLVHCGRSWVISDDTAGEQGVGTPNGEIWLVESEGSSRALFGELREHRHERWEHPAFDLDQRTISYVSESGNEFLTCEPLSIERSRMENPDLWGAYVYAQTVGQNDDPLYLDTGRYWTGSRPWDDPQFDWSVEAVEQFLDEDIRGPSDAYRFAISWAAAQGDSDLEYELRRRYRPDQIYVCGTSMLRRPRTEEDRAELAARQFERTAPQFDFEAFCIAEQRVGCATRLFVENADDRRRTGRPYEGAVAELEGVVDIARFITGLLSMSDSDETLVFSASDVAHLVAGTEWSEEVAWSLEQWMVDERIDALHRAHLAEAWVSLQVEEGVPADVAIADAIEREGASPMLPYIFGD